MERKVCVGGVGEEGEKVVRKDQKKQRASGVGLSKRAFKGLGF